MYKKLVLSVMAVLPLGIAVAPVSTGAVLPVFQNANEPAHCDDFVGQVVFKTLLPSGRTVGLVDGGVTPGKAIWTAVSNDCHDQNVGEYDPIGNPGGVALKRAVVKGVFNYDQNDCSILQGGGFLGGNLAVTWTTRPGTPALTQKVTTINFFKLGWNWLPFGFGDFLHLTLGDGLEPQPSVTGAFTGGDGGMNTQINAIMSQSYGTVFQSGACSTIGGFHQLNFGIGYFRLA